MAGSEDAAVLESLLLLEVTPSHSPVSNPNKTLDSPSWTISVMGSPSGVTKGVCFASHKKLRHTTLLCHLAVR